MNIINKLVILCIGIFSIGFAAKLKEIPVILHQPDGSSIEAYSSGDEFYVRLHTEDNYTIIQSEVDGYYYYAMQDNKNVVPSEFRADSNLPENVSIHPEIRISREEYLQRRDRFKVRNGSRDAPTIGTINNINIFIRFADEGEFGTPRYLMDEPFNKPEGPSMKHYFDEVSYSLLEVNTHHYPVCDMSTNVSYQDVHPRSYYQPYNAQTNPDGYTDANVTIREHTLLKNAVEFVSGEIPLELDVDGNDDGWVDNVTFLVSGSPDGWSDLLWPHRWSLFSFNVYINGAVVDAYNLNLASGGYFNVGTLCHEFFHSLGAPDLYHYAGSGPTAAGGWDIMDGSGDTPQYMSAWMKHKYGNWIDCPEISQMGIYPLLPLQYQDNSCFRLASPNSNTEFFVVEYRKKEGIYEINTPGNDSGMLIYRINANLNGNANGPPDEVYLYRPGGTTYDSGNLNEAVFSMETGRTEFNDSTDPSCFLYGDYPGGLNIRDIGSAGDIIEFTYSNIFVQSEMLAISGDTDGDGVLNPGESAIFTLAASVESGPGMGENVTGILSSPVEWIQFDPPTLTFNTLPANGNAIEASTTISIDDIETLQSADIHFTIQAEFEDEGETTIYADEFTYNISITLNQAGFPLSTAEIRSSPLIIDWNGDGSNEIIVGDYDGVIRIYREDGSEIINSIYPFDTGNQIWGSPAAADLNNDGLLEIVIPSKSKSLIIFNYLSILLEYETDTYLIGTPAIGNLDEDAELEIAFAGYSPNNKIYAINPDGSTVDGFPLDFDEKVKGGIALADITGDGANEIILGTDDDKVHAIQLDGTEVYGFPFQGGDKFQSSPSVLEFDGEIYIAAGCNDDVLYVLKSNGEIQFTFQTEDKVQTSPAFTLINNAPAVFFGSKDDNVYGLTLDGELLPGWPQSLNGDIIGSIVFADVDNDTQPEVTALSEAGEMAVYYLDGSAFPYSPLMNASPFKGAPAIVDLDGDGDLEVLGGSGNNLANIDYKIEGTTNNYWNIFRGNPQRTGFISLEADSCGSDMADVNGDGEINILDLVQISNLILEISIPAFECAADYTQDGEVNILDLVQIANLILDS
ncbi:MAG: M6 family metalloprotease domain-containing protein [Candidatus Marinimicrobia bacterium]|nr:M6 family metalloprotease domain-containing protein [Candidatus Neomarinimicrobiota bacterium]